MMAISQLIEQTIAQHIANPRVISYAGTKKDEVQGRFVASNRVYNFVLDRKGVSYSPAGRQDSLVFSALFLERMDAVKRPKIGNDKCNAGKSYQCGKTCISNSWNCRKGIKDVNDARRIASILASTNERLKASVKVSDKAQARGRALFESRKNRVEKPKTERIKPDDTDALQRLEQLANFGKELSNPTKKPVSEPRQEQIRNRESEVSERLEWLNENLAKKTYTKDNPPKVGANVYYSMSYGENRLPSQPQIDSLNLIKGTVTGVSQDGRTVSLERVGGGENRGKTYKAEVWKLFNDLNAEPIALEKQDLQRYIDYGVTPPERMSKLIDKAAYQKMVEDDFIPKISKQKIKPINPTNVSSIISTIKNPDTDATTRSEYIQILKTALPQIRAGKKFQGYSSAQKAEEVLNKYK